MPGSKVPNNMWRQVGSHLGGRNTARLAAASTDTRRALGSALASPKVLCAKLRHAYAATIRAVLRVVRGTHLRNAGLRRAPFVQWTVPLGTLGTLGAGAGFAEVQVTVYNRPFSVDGSFGAHMHLVEAKRTNRTTRRTTAAVYFTFEEHRRRAGGQMTVDFHARGETRLCRMAREALQGEGVRNAVRKTHPRVQVLVE
jgi:hypothetical protein